MSACLWCCLPLGLPGKRRWAGRSSIRHPQAAAAVVTNPQVLPRRAVPDLAARATWQSEGVILTAVHDTSAPRAGRRFQPAHELALHDVAISACAKLPGAHRGAYVVREMAGPVGIPDFTVLIGDLGLLAARLALDVPPVLNQLDASIVAAASAKVARSPEALARTLGWGVETITRRLPALVRSGALIVARPDRYVRPLPLGPIGRLYAVEAKVRDRQAAVQQARAYSAWTDAYVLVMGPLGQSPLQSLLDEVDIDHGGLVVDGRWLRRPVVRTLDPVRRLWSAEHFVAAVWSSYQPSVAP